MTRPFTFIVIAGAAALIAGLLKFSAFTAAPTALSTATGEHKQISFDDGSTVELNTRSRLEASFSPHARAIHLLAGEALFEVAHDARRSFTVAADCGVVRALGTVFRLRVTDENQCELMVMSGAVAVAAGSLPSRVVTAGQSAWINPAGTTVQEVSPEEIQRRLAWRRGKIWFDGSPLSYAVAEFNRYNASVLVIDDPALAGLRLGGAFNATDVERFVRVLEKMFGVQSQVLQRSGSLEIHLRASDSSDANR